MEKYSKTVQYFTEQFEQLGYTKEQIIELVKIYFTENNFLGLN